MTNVNQSQGKWQSPLMVAILTGVIALFVTNLQTCQNQRTIIRQEEQRFYSELILKSIDYTNEQVTRDNLDLLLRFDLIQGERRQQLQEVLTDTIPLFRKDDVKSVMQSRRDFLGFEDCNNKFSPYGTVLVRFGSISGSFTLVCLAENGAYTLSWTFAYLKHEVLNLHAGTNQIIAIQTNWSDLSESEQRILNTALYEEVQGKKDFSKYNVLANLEVNVDTCDIIQIRL